jgi:hypothetical protein
MESSTLSKALAKSIKIASEHCFESRAIVTSLMTFKVAVTHPYDPDEHIPVGFPDV